MKSAKFLFPLLLTAGLATAAFAQDSEMAPTEDTPAGAAQDPLDAPVPPPDIKDVEKEAATAPAAPSAPVHSESVAAPMTSSVTGDSPDFEREQRFNQIYLKYNSQPTPMDGWEEAASKRGAQSYKVQKGDTLWGVSKTLFGDAFYWPKIWALNNQEVFNPHEIDPWMQIHFYPGDVNEPPTVTVTEDAAAAPAEAPAKKEKEDAIPAPKPRRPIVRTLPPSIPLYKWDLVNRPPPKIDVVEVMRKPFEPNYALSYYVVEDAIAGVGEIKETELGLKSAGEFQYIIVKVNDPSQKNYKVVKEIGRIPEKPTRENQPIARVIEVQGEIEVLQEVNAKASLYRAIVHKTINPIEVGAKLVPGTIEYVNAGDETPAPGPAVRVIGSQYAADRKMVDQGGLIFLDGGRQKGLQEGTVMSVLADPRVRVPETKARVNPRTVGHVRIVRVTPNFATAILTSITDDIRTGDMVGSASTYVSSAVDEDEAHEAAVEDAPAASGPAGDAPAAGDSESGDSEGELDF